MPAAIPKRVEWIEKHATELPMMRRTKSVSEADALVTQLKALGHHVVGVYDLLHNEKP